MNLPYLTLSVILGTYFYACSVQGCVIVALVFSASLCFLWQKQKTLKNIFIFFFVAVLAFAYTATYDYIENKNPSYFLGQTCKVEGKITNITYIEDGFNAINIKATKVSTARMCLYGTHNVLLYVRHGGMPEYAYGDIVIAEAEISNTTSKSDYTLYNASHGVHLQGFSEEENIKITGKDVKALRPSDLAYKIKIWANGVFDTFVQSPEREIVKGMVTGDTSRLPADIEISFRNSGISHVIAVSGMHLSIILTVLMSFFGLFYIQRRVFSLLFYLAFIWLFVLITGSSMSAIRSALMMSIYFTATFLRRDITRLNSLSLALFIILFVNPLSLFDIGLALSASATLSLILLTGYFEKILSKIMPKRLSKIISSTLSAQIGTLPICIMSLGSFSAVSLATNILIYLIVPVIMWGGILLLAVSFFSPAAEVLGLILTYLARLVNNLSDFFSKLPFSVIKLEKPEVLHILIAFSLIALIYFIVKQKALYAKISAGAACLLICLFIFVNTMFPKCSVTFLNTKGSGGAIIYEKNAAILIDGGGSEYSYIPDNDIIKNLEEKGIKKLCAFITKPDIERCGAYPTLMERGYIEKIYIKEDATGNFRKEIIQSAAKNNIEIVFTENEENILFDKIQITAYDLQNFASYRLKFGKKEILFAGGIPEKIIPYSYDCDLLYLAKGCTQNENCEAFIMEAAPIAVLSKDSGNMLYLGKLKFINISVSGNTTIELNQNRIVGLATQRDV